MIRLAHLVLAAPSRGMQIRAPMSRTLVALLFLAAAAGPIPGSLRAQSDENGGLIGLVLPLGARTVGQGRAVAAERAELQALPYSPAAVVGLERGALTYSRFEGADLEDDLDGVNGNYIAGAYVGRWGTLAGQRVYQDLGQVLLTDASPEPIGSIDLSEWVIGLTYANEVRAKVAYGVTAKWYRSDLGVTEASGPAFDAGVIYRPRESVPIALAASLRNLGPDLDFEDTEDVPEERSARLIHPTLGARLRERLTRESSRQHVMLGHAHLLLGVVDDVAVSLDLPVPFINGRGFGVLLHGVHALTAESAQRRMESADTRKQVDEGERCGRGVHVS